MKRNPSALTTFNVGVGRRATRGVATISDLANPKNKNGQSTRPGSLRQPPVDGCRPAASARLLIAGCLAAVIPLTAQGSWERHTIDSDSRGADGVRLADVNGDGRMDVVTGWEEGGRIRIAVHPGAECRRPWPAVTVGRVGQPEDAVLIDLDRDGHLDVVSCCEGKTRTLFAHWAPADAGQYQTESAWTTTPIEATQGKQMWMYAVPMDGDGTSGRGLICGSKGAGGSVGWLQLPANPRQTEDWKYHAIREAGWIMSLIPLDMDHDGDQDLLYSDRKGPRRGVGWLEHPNSPADPASAIWREHRIGGEQNEVMFVDVCDLDQDDRFDILVATRNEQILLFRRERGAAVDAWSKTTIDNPFGVPHGKAVRVADIDLDGRPDIVHTSNTGGDRSRPGVAWMKRRGRGLSSPWEAFDVSGDQGVKFDLIELVDVDDDGDRDIISCEERDNLGVFWYENPVR